MRPWVGALICLLLASRSGLADDDLKIEVAFIGLDYDMPGNATQRGFAYFSRGGRDGGYFQFDLQEWRLGWSGPHLAPGQQQRIATFRFGFLPLQFSRFALGLGGIYEGTTIGVPKAWMLPDDHDYFNAAGLEVTAVMDLVQPTAHGGWRQFQLIGHAGYELGINRLRRPVADLELLVTPIGDLPMIGFNVAVMHSSMDYGQANDDPSFPLPRATLAGTDVMFGIGYVPLPKQSRK